MAKYRKKPIVVDAVQWFPGVHIDGVEEFNTGDAVTEIAGRLKTLEHLGDTRGVVIPGDWVITGVKGEQYACKPDVFAELYEAA